MAIVGKARDGDLGIRKCELSLSQCRGIPPPCPSFQVRIPSSGTLGKNDPFSRIFRTTPRLSDLAVDSVGSNSHLLGKPQATSQFTARYVLPWNAGGEFGTNTHANQKRRTLTNGIGVQRSSSERREKWTMSLEISVGEMVFPKTDTQHSSVQT